MSAAAQSIAEKEENRSEDRAMRPAVELDSFDEFLASLLVQLGVRLSAGTRGLNMCAILGDLVDCAEAEPAVACL